MKPKTILCPFIRHEGRWYLILGWHKRIKVGTPLHLRPLDRREALLVERYIENFSAEAWAVIEAKNQKRIASTKR